MADPLMNRPKGWTPENAHTGGRCEEKNWSDCPTCWGQGRYYEQTPQGVDAVMCGTCLGVGQIQRTKE